MNLLGKFGALLVIVIVCGLSINAVQEAPTDETMEKKLINNYNVYALPMPEFMDFAGEKVPLYNPDIKERMDKYFNPN